MSKQLEKIESFFEKLDLPSLQNVLERVKSKIRQRVEEREAEIQAEARELEKAKDAVS